MRSHSTDLENKNFLIQFTKNSEKITKETSHSSHRQLPKTPVKLSNNFNLSKYLDHLKYENSLKSLKIDQLALEIQSLNSLKHKSSHHETVSETLASIKFKYNEEKQIEKSLIHLKSRINSKKIAWKKKLADFNEIFEKFSEKHKNSLHTKDQAMHIFESTNQKLTKYKELIDSDKESKRMNLESKLKVKKSLEDSSKIMLENISRIDVENKQKKDRISSRLKKISQNFSKVSRLKSELNDEKNLKVHHEIESLKNFAKYVSVSPKAGLGEVVDRVLKKYKDLVLSSKKLSVKFENLSGVVNDRKNNCELLNKEIFELKNKEFEEVREKRIENRHFSLSNQTESLLLKLYAMINTFANEIFIKMQAVHTQTNDPQLFLYIDTRNKFLHSPISRHNTLDKIIPMRSKGKKLTLDIKNNHLNLPGIKNPSPLAEQIRLLKDYFKVFKGSEDIQASLLNNKIIQMFLQPDHDIEKREYINQAELARLLYSRSQINLQGNLKNLVNRILPLLLYLKSCIPSGFNAKPDKQSIKYKKKLVKGIENRFLVKTERHINKREHRSPRGSLIIRKMKITSGSQSPELFNYTKVESLKIFREIDQKLKTIKFKLKF